MSIQLKSLAIYNKDSKDIIYAADASSIVDDLMSLNTEGTGSVSSFSFTNANGFTGVVATPTSTPNLTLALSDSRINSSVLTGFATGSNSTVSATDTILAAFGKTQGQINARISGSGTLNYIPKFTPDGITLGNSLIYDNGTFIGINTTTPFNVNVYFQVTTPTNKYGFLQYDGTSSMAVFVGSGIGGIGSQTTTDINFFTGGGASMMYLKHSNQFVGFGNGFTAPTAVVHVKGSGTTSSTFTAKFYDSALTEILEIRDDGFFSAGKTGVSLIFGRGSGFGGANNSIFGKNCMTGYTSADYNQLNGNEAGRFLTSGSENSLNGWGSGTNITSGNDNTAIGIQSGQGISTTSRTISIGSYSNSFNNVTGTLLIDSYLRINAGDEIANSLFYGFMSSSGYSAQFLRINANFGVATSTFGTNAEKVFAISTGVAPTTSPADEIQIYSSDITAGNAALHTRTEAGDVIKLFKGATIADASGGAIIDAEARTAINSLLARMRVTGGNGLIAD